MNLVFAFCEKKSDLIWDNFEECHLFVVSVQVDGGLGVVVSGFLEPRFNATCCT